MFAHANWMIISFCRVRFILWFAFQFSQSFCLCFDFVWPLFVQSVFSMVYVLVFMCALQACVSRTSVVFFVVNISTCRVAVVLQSSAGISHTRADPTASVPAPPTSWWRHPPNTLLPAIRARFHVPCTRTCSFNKYFTILIGCRIHKICANDVAVNTVPKILACQYIIVFVV